MILFLLIYLKNLLKTIFGGAEAESATIYSIVNTLTELKEVNCVKFLIDGNENCSFKDNCINFSENFVRK